MGVSVVNPVLATHPSCQRACSEKDNRYTLPTISFYSVLSGDAVQIIKGRLQQESFVRSNFFDLRPPGISPSLLVIHNISLPPGEFGGNGIASLFTGNLNPNDHPFYADIAHLRVSAHCVVSRDGSLVQYVNFNDRAWHAGVSVFQGQSNCNNFSIGIELEGTDTLPFSDAQYATLIPLSAAIMQHYPDITLGRIVGHSDIAFGRKTDPGEAFDWCRYRQELVEYRNNHGIN